MYTSTMGGGAPALVDARRKSNTRSVSVQSSLKPKRSYGDGSVWPCGGRASPEGSAALTLWSSTLTQRSPEGAASAPVAAPESGPDSVSGASSPMVLYVEPN